MPHACPGAGAEQTFAARVTGEGDNQSVAKIVIR
jgi:hypothetical protein